MSLKSIVEEGYPLYASIASALFKSGDPRFSTERGAKMRVCSFAKRMQSASIFWWLDAILRIYFASDYQGSLVPGRWVYVPVSENVHLKMNIAILAPGETVTKKRKNISPIWDIIAWSQQNCVFPKDAFESEKEKETETVKKMEESFAASEVEFTFKIEGRDKVFSLDIRELITQIVKPVDEEWVIQNGVRDCLQYFYVSSLDKFVFGKLLTSDEFNYASVTNLQRESFEKITPVGFLPESFLSFSGDATISSPFR